MNNPDEQIHELLLRLRGMAESKGLKTRPSTASLETIAGLSEYLASIQLPWPEFLIRLAVRMVHANRSVEDMQFGFSVLASHLLSEQRDIVLEHNSKMWRNEFEVKAVLRKVDPDTILVEDAGALSGLYCRKGGKA